MDFAVLLIFLVGFTLHSIQVWVDPQAFVDRMKRIRFILNKVSFGILLPRPFLEGFDNNPRLEILFARVSFVVFYFVIILVVLNSLIYGV